MMPWHLISREAALDFSGLAGYSFSVARYGSTNQFNKENPVLYDFVSSQD
jgi:hypothetical protein